MEKKMLLRMWSKDTDKIKILQQELNDLYPQDVSKLKVDGVFGSRTQAKVMKFQRLNGKLKVDGVFGPKTLEQFQLKISNTRLAKGTHLTAPVQTITVSNKALKFQNEMQQTFVKSRKQSEWDTFVKAIDQAVIPEVTKVLLAIQNADTARVLVKAYLQLKSFGFTGKQIGVVFGQLSKLNGDELGKVLGVLGKPTGAFGKVLASAGKVATKMGLIVTFIQCLIYAKKGNYAAIFGEIYKFVMGKMLPWAGIVDALQTFVELVVQKSWKLNVIFKVLKVANPIGLGAVAVESIAASATAAYHVVVVGHGDLGAAIPRLDKLVKRMKKSPVSIFVELGDNAGAATYQLSTMKATEWSLIMSYKWRQFKNLFSR